ncbi:MAG: CBS domain-containing protein [Desulfobacterales bacterium]
MKEILVKNVMIPISNYVTVKPENHLPGVLRAIEEKRQSERGNAHRDAIVIDKNGRFVGKVTMIDIFRALDSGFRKIRDERDERTLTDHFVQKAVRELNLWMDPVETVCQRGSKVTVGEAMHKPEDSEYIQEDDSLEKALSYFVMGVHQPLIVKKGDDVTGVLRFGDLFEVVHKRLVACELT